MTPLIKVKIKKILPILLLLSSSCAHKFDVIKAQEGDEVIFQELKVKITDKDDYNKITVYAQINRTKKQAILDGVGTAGKHIFTLNISNNKYYLIDHLNDKQETGALSDFELIPLDEETIINTLDINKKQSILIKDQKKGIVVEIKVKEQRPLR